MSGLFFAFEGIDGTGKTTQIKRLRHRLEAHGYRVIETKEPTDGLIGKFVRESLKQESTINEASSALLFAADRMDHLLKKGGLLDLLADDDVVILCDRYLLSSLAYNSLKEPLEWVLAINKNAQALLTPTAHLLLDLPEQKAMQRIEDRKVPLERYESLHQLHQVRTLYRSLADTLGDENIIILDADTDEETLANNIWQTVSPYLSKIKAV